MSLVHALQGSGCGTLAPSHSLYILAIRITVLPTTCSPQCCGVLPLCNSQSKSNSQVGTENSRTGSRSRPPFLCKFSSLRQFVTVTESYYHVRTFALPTFSEDGGKHCHGDEREAQSPSPHAIRWM